MTVLLVDDDDGVRDLLEHALRTRGYVVLAAAHADEADALASAASVGVDLLVCDVCLPGASGVELARRLATQHAGLQTVLMSGDPSMDAFARDAVAAATFLGKPFTTSQLIDTVRAVTGR